MTNPYQKLNNNLSKGIPRGEQVVIIGRRSVPISLSDVRMSPVIEVGEQVSKFADNITNKHNGETNMINKPEFKLSDFKTMSECNVFDIYIYHANCMDGLAAVGVAIQPTWGTNHEIETIAMAYGDHVPVDDYKDKRICFLDFSVGKTKMLEILAVASHVTVIDHHVSVHEELSSIDADNFEYVYHIGASGAMLAWKYFIKTVSPWFIDLISDRDLWSKQYVEADFLNLALRVENMDVFNMGLFISNLIKFKAQSEETAVYPGTYDLIEDGRKYHKYHTHIVGQIINKDNVTTVHLEDGAAVLKVNCPVGFVSDVGSVLARRSPSGVAWLYSDVGGKRVNSLRVSPDSDYDASAYAKKMGGGGHRRAAGWNGWGVSNK